MAPNATDHEIGPRVWEIDGFNTVLYKRDFTPVEWLQARIQSPIDAVRCISDEVHRRRRSRSCRLSRNIGIDVLRLCLIAIHDRLVKSANDEVDRPTCLDFDGVRYQLVFVTESRCWIIGGEPIQRLGTGENRPQRGLLPARKRNAGAAWGAVGLEQARGATACRRGAGSGDPRRPCLILRNDDAYA